MQNGRRCSTIETERREKRGEAMYYEETSEVRPLTAEERDSIHLLCMEHYPALSNYAYTIVCDWDLAAEAVQETFLDACRRPTRLLAAPSPLRWLKKACSLNCFELKRNGTRHQFRHLCIDDPAVQRLVGVYELISDAEICSNLDITCEDLELLRRIYIDNCDRETLAGEFGLNERALSKRIDRLRWKIKK